MVEAVVNGKQQALTRRIVAHLFRQQTDRRIGFLGCPELRFLTAPDIDNSPFTVTDTVALVIFRLGCTGKFFPERSAHLRFGQHERLVDISPNRTPQTSGSIKQAAPHLIDRDSPELTDVRIILQSLIGIASRVRPFIEQSRDAMPLVITRRTSPLIQVAIHILIMHAENIIYRLLLAHRTGITENDRTCRIRCFHPIPAILEILSVHTLVSNRPEQDGRMRTECLHHLTAL